MAFEPFLESFGKDYDLPASQSIANAAIIVVFTFLLPLLTMEINYFRLAIYQSWKTRVRLKHRELNKNNRNKQRSEEVAIKNEEMEGTDPKVDALKDGTESGEEQNDDVVSDREIFRNPTIFPEKSVDCNCVTDNGRGFVRCVSLSTFHDSNNADLEKAYRCVRWASAQAILLSMTIYSATALGIALSTRGLDPKVIAIITGASKFLASLIAFIISTKVPQWIGVYHQRSIHLVKCSSNYSKHAENIDITNEDHLASLRTSVRVGVCFHFAKFYIILMPFYCGVQAITIPLSMLIGVGSGFILICCMFLVHEKYIHHRNAVAFTTIFFLIVISSLTFVRGVAWIQAVWNLNIFEDEDALIVISFFSWLGVLAIVHILFIVHTLKTEKREQKQAADRRSSVSEQAESPRVQRNNVGARGTMNEDTQSGNELPEDFAKNPSLHRNSRSYCSFFAPGKTPPHGKRIGSRRPPRNSSYNSFIFDPRTHFKDVKEQQYLEPVETFSTEGGVFIDDDSNIAATEGAPKRVVTKQSTSISVTFDESSRHVSVVETPIAVVTDGTNHGVTDPKQTTSRLGTTNDSNDTDDETTKRPSTWCEIFACTTPEYKASSLPWKVLCWVKIFVLIMAYLLCLYFVAVSIGATKQIAATRKNLPYVHEVLYNHMNEGEVCAFDNRGPESNITTFPNKEAAHEAGFLVVHCGACGACSSWENLIIQHTTRNSMAALANDCAKKSLFGGGDDALHQCLMDEKIGFSDECALCWMEDILCTKDHCAFIFLQAQMINNVGNFAVGENDITSASCEEAHCEVGQFVPCSGATRRRMNIVSSIARPGEQQCAIVDVQSWEDLFFGSGVA